MHKTLTFAEFEKSYGRQHYTPAPPFLFFFFVGEVDSLTRIHSMSLLVKGTCYRTKDKPMFFIIYDFVFVVKRFILIGTS